MAAVAAARRTRPADAAPLPFPRAGRRLIVVSPTYAPEPLGTPLYAADTVAWLVDAGWDVEVVTSQPFYPAFERYEGYGRATRRDVVDGVPVRRLPTVVPRGGRASWRAVGDANFLAQGLVRAATRWVRRAPTVLSISPGTPVAPVIGSALRTRGGRHVCLVHDVQSGLAAGLGMVKSDRAARTLQAVERRALDRADQLLTLSDQMAGVVRGLGVRQPVDVLPLWATVAPPPGVVSPAAMTDVQFSGNLGRKQGLDQLVALAAGLRAVRPHTTFTIRGDGPMASAFGESLRAAGLDIDVEPPVPTEALPAALMSSRVHIVPQLASTAAHVVPSKIVNALAVGGAVLAFSSEDSPVAHMAARCDAIRVVQPGAVDAAVAAACDLLDGHEPAALRRAATTYAAAHHDRDVLLERLHHVLIGEERATWPPPT